jgi:hypothetical protein
MKYSISTFAQPCLLATAELTTAAPINLVRTAAVPVVVAGLAATLATSIAPVSSLAPRPPITYPLVSENSQLFAETTSSPLEINDGPELVESYGNVLHSSLS